MGMTLDWTAFGLGAAAGMAAMVAIYWWLGRAARVGPAVDRDIDGEPDWWTAPAEALTLPADLRSQVLILRAEGRGIEAIKLVRTRMDCGLKDARDLVDDLR
jgi:hypothetical protein